MLLNDALKFIYSLNITQLNEGYKDLSAAYNITEPDEYLRKAFEMFSKNPNIKRIIKSQLGTVNGSIEKAIATKFQSPEDFINAVDAASQQDKASAQKGQAKEQMNKNISANENNGYWLIPCKTFEEAKRAAQMHKGNLPTLSFDKLRNEYGINAPKPAEHYETHKSPAEFLEFMKSAKFFMSPSWCIAADKTYWNEYELNCEPDESPRCWIIISKKWPNVRFCITLGENGDERAHAQLDKKRFRFNNVV